MKNILSRRLFIKNTIAVGAGFVILKDLTSFPEVSEKEMQFGMMDGYFLKPGQNLLIKLGR